MSGQTVCKECKFYCVEQLFKDGPYTVECEEEMNNFLLSEGCYMFERREDDYEDR